MMSSLLFIVTLLIWIPLIPLRLVIQIGVPIWRRLGVWTSLIFFLYWLVVDSFVLRHYETWARYQIPEASWVPLLGFVLILLSGGAAYWISTTLGWGTLFLRPELSPEKVKASLISEGPYRIVRHPFYLMEWFLLSGLTLVTGSWIILGILASTFLLDPFVTYFEEKELLERFGPEYAGYQKKVPRLLPTLTLLFSKKGN